MPAEETAAQELPPLNDQMTFLPVTTSVHEGKTAPPKSYTEAMLLSAMENAGVGERPNTKDWARLLPVPESLRNWSKPDRSNENKVKKGVFYYPHRRVFP